MYKNIAVGKAKCHLVNVEVVLNIYSSPKRHLHYAYLIQQHGYNASHVVLDFFTLGVSPHRQILYFI